MYVNTKTRLMCDLMGPKLRLLFEGGFYSSAAFIQDFTVIRTQKVRTSKSLVHSFIFLFCFVLFPWLDIALMPGATPHVSIALHMLLNNMQLCIS